MSCMCGTYNIVLYREGYCVLKINCLHFIVSVFPDTLKHLNTLSKNIDSGLR